MNSQGCPFPKQQYGTMPHIPGTQMNSDEFHSNKATSLKGNDSLAHGDSLEEKEAQIVSNKALFESINEQCQQIEDGIRQGEMEVIAKEEEAFIAHRAEVELVILTTQQAEEKKKKKESFDVVLSSRINRKKAKQILRQMTRETKIRDNKIHQQNLASQLANEVKHNLLAKRTAFEEMTGQLERRHEKQRKQLSATQERKLSSQKLLSELECRHLKEEVRVFVMKKYQEKMIHQKSLNKRVSENLREMHRLEIRHAKERFDVEFTAYENIQNLRSRNNTKLGDFEARHYDQIGSEKERLAGLKETLKIMQIEKIHQNELKRLAILHKQSHKMLKDAHRERMKQGTSRAVSKHSPRHESRSNSVELAEQSDVNNTLVDEINSKNRGANQEEEQETIERELEQLRSQLESLVIDNKEARDTLIQIQKEELENKERGALEMLRETIEKHESEFIEQKRSHEAVIAEILKIHEREESMQAIIHETENKAHLESRMLNSVLDAIIDGIINIDTKGTLLRFNHSAEKMFGYSASEVIGKNIKMLMPVRFAQNHDGYLNNYLTTGVKMVIGSGRSLFGKKKDGSEFPIFLSVSEVNEDGARIFTGIIRDISEEVDLQREAKEMAESKQKKLKDLVVIMDKYKSTADNLIKHMLPSSIAEKLMKGIPIAPQTYANATYFVSDIVGFTKLSSASSPFQIVQFLNSLYTAFDQVIAKYDCFKVQTVGDAYLIVSGVPKPNGNRHVSEIATMALELLSVVYKFNIPHMPGEKLAIRIGLHTGPCVAGVVGSTMPKYCLFGDSLSVASKLESGGTPMRIQISDATYSALQNTGGFKFSAVKDSKVDKEANKDVEKAKTYWLIGKDGFGYPLPPLGN